MKIVSAAIKFRFSAALQDSIMTAVRHADIYEELHGLDVAYDKSSVIEGFMTDTNEFVDRYEAKEIAVAANQLIVPIEETYNALYSEDVW